VAHSASLPVVILFSSAGNGAGRTGDQMPNNNIPQILIQPLKPALIAGVAQKLPVLIPVFMQFERRIVLPLICPQRFRQ
jgi:hypothetical protein